MRNVMPRGYRGMVASPHHLASAVGMSVLHRGGNAFDAAVATSAALAVAYPHMTGLGGDAFFLCHDARTGELSGLNGSGRAGADVTCSLYVDRGLRAIPRRGALSSVTVPGMVDAWWEVWLRKGTLPWAALIEPAVEYAVSGVPVAHDLARSIVLNERLLAQDGMRRVFMPDGVPPAVGSKLVQTALARSLAAIRDGGRDAFYDGPLMQEMVRGLRAEGGHLGEDDFRAHRGEWVEPVSTSYRGSRIVQMPPNSQGFSALMMMNMLEQADVAAVGRDSPEYFGLVTEAVALALRDRDEHLSDPDYCDIPLERLLSKEYAVELLGGGDWRPDAVLGRSARLMGPDTAYAAIVDQQGNAVSFIQSLYSGFGSALMAGDTGVILQNRGSYFSLDPSDVNVLLPGKRTAHTLMPAMVTNADGRPVLLLGTQGGEGQPQTQLSLLTGVLDFGYTVQEAISSSRWLYDRGVGGRAAVLKLESRVPASTVRQLREWGHAVEMLGAWDPAVGQAQGIAIRADGQLSGAADPRGDGLAIGW